MGYRVIDGKLHIIENFKSADAYSARNSVNTEDKKVYHAGAVFRIY